MSLGAEIRGIVAALVGASALLVGLVLSWGLGEVIRLQQTENIETLVGDRCDRLQSAMKGLQRDVAMLARMEEVRRLADGSLDPGLDEREKERLAGHFTALLETRAEYVQARLIGIAEDGRELVRVDRTQDGIERVHTTGLQSKGSRDYFREGLAIPEERVYLSQVSLNREGGKIEVPHVPMLRAAQRVVDRRGEPFGLLVINVKFDAFLRTIFAAEIGRYRLYVANEEGHFLFHEREDLTYGFDLGFDHGIASEFPGVTLATIDPLNGLTTPLEGGHGAEPGLVHFQRVRASPERELIIGMAGRYADVKAHGGETRRQAFLLTAILLTAALIGAYVFSRRLTRPLDEITEAARKIASGADEVFLPVDCGNEVGSVAKALQHMLHSLREKENSLVDAGERMRRVNADLEHFTKIASHDLREPARRMVMLANVLESEREGLNDQGKGLVERITVEAQGMLDQITDLRVLSGIGDGELVREPVDPALIFQRLLGEFRWELEERGVEVRIDEHPVIDCYESLVTVLYRNLIANALAHAQPGPFLLHLTCETGNGEPVLGVRNTRSTIPEAFLDGVFKPLSKGSGSSGTGLGLSICRRVVERHTGRIQVTADHDQVHFTFTLPKSTQ